MRLAVLVFGFALLFNYLFNPGIDLMVTRLLPAVLPAHPQARLGHAQIIALDVFLDWVVPLAVAAIFILKTKIRARSASRPGWILMAVAVGISLLRTVLLYATTFVQGGGATLVTAYLFAYLDLPLRLLLVIGAVKLLMAPEPTLRAA